MVLIQFRRSGGNFPAPFRISSIAKARRNPRRYNALCDPLGTAVAGCKGVPLTKTSIPDNGVSRRHWSAAQRIAILKEMNRVLSHPTFKSSKRCSELLSYLVDRALAGEEEGIKERILGIEVFGRDPNYDTNSDPIVRRTANEIRKRLGQCYFEPYGRPAVTIHMARGSYLLEFEFEGDVRLRDQTETEEPEDDLPEPAESEELGNGLAYPIEAVAAETEPTTAQSSREPIPQVELERPLETPSRSASKLLRRGWFLGIAVVLLLAVVCLLLVWFDGFRSPEYKLWKPLLASGDRITLCVSDVTPLVGADGAADSRTAPSNPLSHGTPQKTPFLDMRVAEEIATLLLEFKRQTNLQPSSALTFQDFRQGPTVLIGGTINPWASILLSKLRYTLRVDPVTLDKWIQDAQNPSMRNWKINGKPLSSENFDDYAVITRFFDTDTGQWIMALSGLEAHGTEAAGELVADPAFAKFVPPGLRSTGNFQIVIKTPVMRGSTGPLEVLAVYTW